MKTFNIFETRINAVKTYVFIKPTADTDSFNIFTVDQNLGDLPLFWINFTEMPSRNDLSK